MKSEEPKFGPNPDERVRILGALKRLVRKYHINVAGVNYEAWMASVDQRLPELLTAETGQFEIGVRQLLSELGSSHTAFYHEQAQQLLPQHTINATLRRFSQAGAVHWFFLDVFEGGPAQAAGIRPGDILLAVDGNKYNLPTTPSFDVGRTYILTIANARGENAIKAEVRVPMVKGTGFRPPIVEPKSLYYAMVSESVGLLKVRYFPGATGLRFAKDLDLAIANLKQQGTTQLVIDLRGNIGGGLGLARLASYMCSGRIPIGYSLTPSRLRRGYKKGDLPHVPMPRSMAEMLWTLARFAFHDKSVVLLTQGLGPQPFHDHTVLLVNEWTNSAAEMVAAFASENGVATIVGQRTAGNVLGATNFKVGNGYWVRLPIYGWYTSKGVCLEGKGVSPEVVVEIDPAYLNTGIDQQMNKALETLSGRDSSPKTQTGGNGGDQLHK